MRWWLEGDSLCGENEFLPNRPKKYDFAEPDIKVEIIDEGIKLTSDKPALKVTYDHGGQCIYDRNCITLLPGQPKVIKPVRLRGIGEISQQKDVWSLNGKF